MMKKRILSLLLTLTLLLTFVPLSSQAAEPAGFERAYGNTRYDTAFIAADLLKEQLGISKFSTVVVASGVDFADALSGSYLAAVKGAPMLLVRDNNTTMNQVKAYIKANLKSGGTVYLLGGEKAVPKAMASGLEGFTVKRLGGNTRYDTNLIILREAGVGSKDILVCTGKDFADSLSASATKLPILLVKDSFTAAQKEFLQGTSGKKYIIGGTNAVSTRVETALKAYGTVKRLGGNTRYETSVLVAREFFRNPTSIVLAYAQNFPDGLSGGALAAGMNAPLILTASGKDTAAAKYNAEFGITEGFVLGGATLINDKAVNNIYVAAKDAENPSGVQTFNGDFTYTDRVTSLATNWNPHTYPTADDAYPADFLRVGLYSFYFNDALNPVKGLDAFEGYVILPEMAASMPVDVTEQVKAAHPEFGIPKSATEGFAYVIDLNPKAVWEDGTPINADTYVESMKRLLDPKLINYRATNYYAYNLCIAGAEAYARSGRTIHTENQSAASYTFADLTKGADGQYLTPNGEKVFIALNFPLTDWLGGNTLKDYVDAYGADYFDVTNWNTLIGMADADGLIPLTDANKDLFLTVIGGNSSWGETEENLPAYLVYDIVYPEASWDNVGLMKTGDYQITLVLGKPLTGFNLLYNLSANWIVKTDLYDACLKQTNGVWTSTYNTSVATTCSYGPYKLVSYQAGKAMHFEKNENWYGYTDGKHIYQDPKDGLLYPMYQTTEIDCNVVAENATAKQMFLKGELMTYGLQADDFAAYRQSDYCYATPNETIFFLILNGHMEAIQKRESAADFDRTAYDLETLTLKSFHQAVGLTYDRDLFAATVSPARSGGFGIIGDSYIYDLETGAKYRDTDQAKQVLCDFYAVDTSKFASLDEAVASITGYDPKQAKAFYKQAFNEAIAAGYITDNDGDGICDQTIKIEYAMSSDSAFMTQTINYLNEKIAEATAGTPFEGKVLIVKSAPYGSGWSIQIKQGLSDIVLGGWSSSALNPYSLTDVYTSPSFQYDAAWYDATKIDLTINVPVAGKNKNVTLTLKQWSDALNGTTVTVDGVAYNFGSDAADTQVRLNILAACEAKILASYNYLPMLQDGSMSLLSQKAYYVTKNYNPLLGRGGIAYLRYNYTDAEWAKYVASQPNGELTY